MYTKNSRHIALASGVAYKKMMEKLFHGEHHLFGDGAVAHTSRCVAYSYSTVLILSRYMCVFVYVFAAHEQ